MKFLIVSSLHHPQELAEAQAKAPTGETLFFPPAQAEFFLVRSLRKLGHEVEAFIVNVPAVFGRAARQSERSGSMRLVALLEAAVSSRAPRLHPDYQIRNRRLCKTVECFEPDVLLLFGGNRVIYPETLARIKSKYGCKIVYLCADSPIVFANATERASAPLYDLVLVNDYYHGIEWQDYGSPRMEVLPISACDPEFHHSYELSPDEQTALGCDVGFVGTLVPPKLYSNRVEMLEAVSDWNLGVWSIHVIPPSLQPHYRGPALGEQMLRALCGSKIQLNTHGNSMRYGGNMRLFEAAGCGVFQIADDLPGNCKWFTPGETIVTYRDRAHLREQVAYYLQHDTERQQIARAAQAHVYAHHTYDQRMAALVQLCR